MKNPFFLFLFVLSPFSWTAFASEELPLVRNPSLRIGFVDAINQLATIHPAYFDGHRSINRESKEALRRSMKKDGARMALVEHSEALIPEALKLNSLVNAISDQKLRRKLALEISYKIEAEEVSYSWLLSAMLRIQAAASTFSEKEGELFNFFKYSELFAGLSGKNPHGSELVALVHEISHKKISQPKTPVFYPRHAHYVACESLRLELAARTLPLFVAAHGHNVLGIGTIACSLLNNERAIGLGDGGCTVHTIEKMSRGSFAIHDVLHGLVDPQFCEFINYAVNLMDLFIEKGGDAKTFIDVAPKSLAAEFDLMAHYQQQLLVDMFARFSQNDPEAFRKALVGYFILLHEFPYFEAKHYKDRSILNVLLERAQGTKTSIQEDPLFNAKNIDNIISASKNFAFNEYKRRKGEDRWRHLDAVRKEFSNDNHQFTFLQHNKWPGEYPIIKITTTDGQSLILDYYKEKERFVMSAPDISEYSEVEIDEGVKEELKMHSRQYMAKYFQPINLDDRLVKHENDLLREEFEEAISAMNVEENPNFVYLYICLKSGEEHHFRQPTAQFSWAFLDDYISLLKEAGITVVKPSLEGLDDNDRNKAMALIYTEVKRGLCTIIDEFTSYARRFFLEPRRGGSLDEQYGAEKQRLQRELKSKLQGNSI